jgi:hypothetical protein
VGQASLPADLGFEQEVDLSRWARLIRRRWWILLVGVGVGAFVGLLLGVSTTFRASVFIQPAQAFGPTGEPILNYQASSAAIAHIVSSGTALVVAAKAAALSPAVLKGHVSVQNIPTGASSSTAARGATIFEIDVLLPHRSQAGAADNALAAFLITNTTSPYVRQSIENYTATIHHDEAQINLLRRRVRALNHLFATTRLSSTERVVIVGQASDAEQQIGSIFDDLSRARSQLTLTSDLGRAKLIGGPANVTRSTARTRSTSTAVGAAIGLLLAVGAVIYVERRRRPLPG